MGYDKMKRAEAVALTNFVVKRLKLLDPQPRFLGKVKWGEKLLKFELDFIDVLVNGKNNFYGAVWQFFEGNDKIFLGEYGMRELADNTQKKENKWYIDIQMIKWNILYIASDAKNGANGREPICVI